MEKRWDGFAVRWGYHLMALVTAAIWGTTFVSTKVLIQNGLTPAEIFLYRFSLAYVVILLFSRRRLRALSWRDEGWFALAGIFGGSLYFITENTALGITLASNVSLLVCTSPVLTALLSALFYRYPLRRRMLYGSFLALLGVALVVFNGSVLLKINPLGDLLTLSAALSWALYCLVLRRFSGRYGSLFVTRKVFFYGLLSMSCYFLFDPLTWKAATLARPVVWMNLLFLGLVASMLCYLMWNASVKALGAERATNYLYVNPLVTMVTSSIVLGERITPTAILGCALIICGVYWAERHG